MNGVKGNIASCISIFMHTLTKIVQRGFSLVSCASLSIFLRYIWTNSVGINVKTLKAQKSRRQNLRLQVFFKRIFKIIQLKI